MSPFPRRHLRQLLRVVNGGTPTADPENWDGEVPWATPIDLAPVNGKLLAATTRTLTTRGLATGSSEVPPNSLIMSTRAPIGYVAQVARSTAFNQGCRGLVPREPVDIRYIRYQLLSAAPTLQNFGQGSTFLELSSDSLSELPLFVPSVNVQRAIADYLDAETAHIDALIEKKRRMVELLEERRALEASLLLAATVQHGLEHLGACPWVPLRYVATVRGGLTLGKRYEEQTVRRP